MGAPPQQRGGGFGGPERFMESYQDEFDIPFSYMSNQEPQFKSIPKEIRVKADEKIFDDLGSQGFFGSSVNQKKRDSVSSDLSEENMPGMGS